VLQQQGVQIKPLLPSNCGFDVGWSAYFAEKFAGQPFKTVAITVPASNGSNPGQNLGQNL
jgi:predicted flavoprotein YhiN